MTRLEYSIEDEMPFRDAVQRLLACADVVALAMDVYGGFGFHPSEIARMELSEGRSVLAVRNSNGAPTSEMTSPRLRGETIVRIAGSYAPTQEFRLAAATVPAALRFDDIVSDTLILWKYSLKKDPRAVEIALRHLPRRVVVLEDYEYPDSRVMARPYGAVVFVAETEVDAIDLIHGKRVSS